MTETKQTLWEAIIDNCKVIGYVLLFCFILFAIELLFALAIHRVNCTKQPNECKISVNWR